MCIAIAAAIYYKNDEDESAVELGRIRREEGIDAVLEKVCQISSDGDLAKLIKEKIELLKEWGWINE